MNEQTPSGCRVIDQNVNPENISFLVMWSDASLEDSKVEATKDTLPRLGKPTKSADVKAEVEKLHWEHHQAFPLFGHYPLQFYLALTPDAETTGKRTPEVDTICCVLSVGSLIPHARSCT